MKNPLLGLLALALCAGVTMPVGATDNDIFQTTLFFHKKPATTAYASPLVTAAPCCPQPQPACASCAPVAAPACNSCAQPSCAQPSCSTSYVQKSYYQAVTSYQTRTYYEPVTQYQTSYYYEPVTSYRTSYYYCPQSCSYQQTVSPETSYQLKTKSCPIQSYVAKCTQVPVTTYQQKYYLEPQTTCCQTTVGALVSAPAPPQVSVTPGPASPPPPLPPVINEQRGPAAPQAPSYYPPQTPAPPQNGASWQPATPAPIQATPAKQPSVKLDRIVFGSDATVEGQVVRGDNTPRPNARVLFVNANQSSLRETISANDVGRFMVSLASGGWLVYVYDLDNNPVFNSRIEVNDGQSAAKIILVNR